MRCEGGAEEDKEEGAGGGQGVGGVDRLGGSERHDRERVPEEHPGSGPSGRECGPLARAFLHGATQGGALLAHSVPCGG